ncbi:Uncharacterised protein [Vibrio cholerae]|nr:Uncharacterised protein [Vibrio cholerae]
MVLGGAGSFSLTSTVTGGTRTTSPASSLYSAFTRFLFTRTSPLRRIR